MPTEVRIAGESCALLLTLEAWEFPELLTGADANWIVATAEIAGGGSGQFGGRMQVHVRTEEISEFRDELAAALESMTGEARLDAMEDNFGATVTFQSGVSELSIFLKEHVGASITQSGPTNQSFLFPTLQQLQSACAEFPTRGELYD